MDIVFLVKDILLPDKNSVAGIKRNTHVSNNEYLKWFPNRTETILFKWRDLYLIRMRHDQFSNCYLINALEQNDDSVSREPY